MPSLEGVGRLIRAHVAWLQEVDSIGRNAAIGPAELARMPYLDAVLKESMRLYPPGHLTPRQPVAEDFTVKGYTIPKGTWIHVRSASCSQIVAALLALRALLALWATLDLPVWKTGAC